MAIGFPASATRQIVINAHQAQIAQAIPIVLDSLRWSGYQISPASFTASVGMSWLSWGERIRIDFISPNGIQVTSKCCFPLQCFDWGKNERNIRASFDGYNSASR